MAIHALILNREILEGFEALREYAEKHPLSIDHQLDQINGEGRPAGDMGPYTMQAQSYRIVFTHDEHPKGTVRHLSVSVPDPGALPDPTIMKIFMRQLGFENEFIGCKIWFEKIGPDHEAVNVAELIPSNNLHP